MRNTLLGAIKTTADKDRISKDTSINPVKYRILRPDVSFLTYDLKPAAYFGVTSSPLGH